MEKLMKRLSLVSIASALVIALCAAPSIAQITEIIDSTGAGGLDTLDGPFGFATDLSGNVFIAGESNNAFRITPGGVITQIMDETGDGAGHPFISAGGAAADSAGNVFVAGWASQNVFKISPVGVITQIIDSTGAGGLDTLDSPYAVATDNSGNVFVTGFFSHNAFKITAGGVITEIIDETGDGGGNGLQYPRGVATDTSGNVFVTASGTTNAFKITPDGVVTQIIGPDGDGEGNTLLWNRLVETDIFGNVFVTGRGSHNAFKITPDGTITQIIDSTGNGDHGLNHSAGVATDYLGNVFVSGRGTDNVFKITPAGVVTEIIHPGMAGEGKSFHGPLMIGTDVFGNVYALGYHSDNVFKIPIAPPITVDIKVFLEGAYLPSDDSMSTAINAILPLSQPYDSTLFDGTQLDYDGLESVVTMPPDIVDWVLVQLRTGDPASPPMDSVATRAALLKSDGTIVDLDGSSPLSFSDLPDDNYHIAIFHRNHLGIITPAMVALSSASAQYDFTTASTKAFGSSPMKEVETGVWSMFAGDGSVDGQITANDFNLWLADTKAVATGYIQTDFNLDGLCTATDFNLWLVNTKSVAVSRVP